MHHFHRLNSQRGIYPVAATIEDSTEEFLTASSREGSFGHPSTRRYSTGGGSFAPTTTTLKESAPTMTRFPPWTVASQPETKHPSEQHHAHNEGQLAQANARRPLLSWDRCHGKAASLIGRPISRFSQTRRLDTSLCSKWRGS
jgi:hypothetical protein